MFEKLVKRLIRSTSFLMFILMIIIVFAQVILRYFLNAPLAWSDELSRLLLVWVSFLGVTLVHFSPHGHPAVTALVDKFPSKAHAYVTLTLNLIMTISLLALCNASLEYTLSNTTRVSAVLHYPNALKYAVVPISTALMAIKSAIDVFSNIKLLKAQESEEK